MNRGEVALEAVGVEPVDPAQLTRWANRVRLQVPLPASEPGELLRRGELRGGAPQLFLDRLATARVADRADDRGPVGTSLGEVVLGPLGHGRERRGLVVVAGQDDDRKLGEGARQRLEAAEPGRIGHREVEQHAVDAAAAQGLDRRTHRAHRLELHPASWTGSSSVSRAT